MYQYAGIRGNFFRSHIHVKGKIVADFHDVANFLLGIVHTDNDTNQRQHADYQQNFAAGNAAALGSAESLPGGALIKLYRSPEDDKNRPPSGDKKVQIQVAVVVQQEQNADRKKNQSREEAAAARWGGHSRVIVPATSRGFADSLPVAMEGPAEELAGRLGAVAGCGLPAKPWTRPGK